MASRRSNLDRNRDDSPQFLDNFGREKPPNDGWVGGNWGGPGGSLGDDNFGGFTGGHDYTQNPILGKPVFQGQGLMYIGDIEWSDIEDLSTYNFATPTAKLCPP